MTFAIKHHQQHFQQQPKNIARDTFQPYARSDTKRHPQDTWALLKSSREFHRTNSLPLYWTILIWYRAEAVLRQTLMWPFWAAMAMIGWKFMENYVLICLVESSLTIHHLQAISFQVLRRTRRPVNEASLGTDSIGVTSIRFLPVLYGQYNTKNM